jgi:N-acetylmuramoyl-L-alanine amidase
MAVFFTATFAGCAARSAYLRLEPSLGKSIVTVNGVEYLPLKDLCNVYGLDYSWDSFARKATIRKGSDEIVTRSGSRLVLVNGLDERLTRQTILYGGVFMVPVSFMEGDTGRIIGAIKEKAVPEKASSGKFTIRTIMLDPGHGGKDSGAIGRRLRVREDSMALDLARKIKVVLESAGINVVMTRNRDEFIPLSRRAQMANKSGADIFISVHINASRSRSLRGFECYFLSNAMDDNARSAEVSRNAEPGLCEGATMERSRRLSRILWDMALSENRRESAQLADYICDSVDKSLSIGNRGVRSARFYVLKYTRIPAVLVEAGYISNRYEEMRLKDPRFLDRIADAVAQGILRYKLEYERTEGFTV